MTLAEIRACLEAPIAWEVLDTYVALAERRRQSYQRARAKYCDERARQIAQTHAEERFAVVRLCDAIAEFVGEDSPGPDPDQRARLRALIAEVMR